MQTKPIIIVGAGPAGCLLALKLAAKNIPVTLIENDTPDNILNHLQDGRTTALSYGSMEFLQTVGLDEVLKKEATPIQEIRISTEDSTAHLHFGQKESGGRPMGFIVPNTRLRQILLQQVLKTPAVTLRAPCTYKSLTQTPDSVTLHFAHGDPLEGTCVVGADGRFSKIRQEFQRTPLERPYDQRALVFEVQCEKPHKSVAFEHFTAKGPLALLPLQTHHCSVVWSLNDPYADQVQALTPERFDEELNRAFGQTLGTLTVVSKISAYPLRLLAMKASHEGRLVVVGDASHVMHPVAGQGLNVGLRDVEELANLWIEAHALGLDPGSFERLQTYTQRRQADIFSMSAITHGLVKGFSNDSRLTRALRNTGLRLARCIPGLKTRMTHHAMGITS